jgi:ribosomal protein L37AE/L43A
MGVMTRVKRLVGGGADAEPETETETETEDRDPSHVCDSCGEEYYADPDTEIPECRECGGIRVDPV